MIRHEHLRVAINAALAVLSVLALYSAFALLSSCAWSSRSRTVTTERERIQGTVGGLPVDVVRERTAQQDSHEQGEQDLGLMGAIAAGAQTALTGGSTLATGGAAGLAVGLLGMGWQYLQKRKVASERDRVARQRDEIIDGVERSKDDLGDKWGALTAALEKEQSRDTKDAVKARTG